MRIVTALASTPIKARQAASGSPGKKSPAQGRAFRLLVLALTVASATARSASATTRRGVDVRRASAAMRHRGRGCARGGRGRHLRACAHRRATAAARRIGLCHMGHGALDPRRRSTHLVMTAGHDRRRSAWGWRLRSRPANGSYRPRPSRCCGSLGSVATLSKPCTGRWRAKEAGGRIVKDKFSIGDYGNIALVSDPDGNVVGFHSMV